MENTHKRAGAGKHGVRNHEKFYRIDGTDCGKHFRSDCPGVCVSRDPCDHPDGCWGL